MDQYEQIEGLIDNIQNISDLNSRESQEEKFIKWAVKYYPIKIKEPATDSNIWYCNISGIPISHDIHEEYEKFYDDVASKFYKEGMDHSNVYKCGHRIIDIFMLSAIYEHLTYPWYPAMTLEKTDEIINMIEKCPFCCENNIDHHLYYIYKIVTPGSINFHPSHIPKKHLGKITGFQRGDVVETDKSGLCIFNGTKFSRVKIVEYYPIWPLKYLKLRGYRYYLNLGNYDILKFENNVGYLQQEAFVDMKNITSSNINIDAEELPSKIDLNILQEVSYPFKNHHEANEYIFNKFTVWAKISDSDVLVFYGGNVVITDLNGDNIIHLS